MSSGYQPITPIDTNNMYYNIIYIYIIIVIVTTEK